MPNHERFEAKLLCLILLFSSLMAVYAQKGTNGQLLGEAQRALSAAKNANAEALSPKNYQEAGRLFSEAKTMSENPQKNEQVGKLLKSSLNYSKRAQDFSRSATAKLTKALHARGDAKKAGAPNFATKRWDAAEKQLKAAIARLEDGGFNAGPTGVVEVEAAFRDAESTAIKNHLLGDAREMLKKAGNQGAGGRAPITLQQAKELLASAEYELDNNRYDTDVARVYAEGAGYEAAHAIALSEKIKSLKASQATQEQILLEAEMSLQAIAWSLNRTAKFDRGTAAATTELVTFLTAFQDSVLELNAAFQAKDLIVTAQRAYIEELDKAAGKATDETADALKKLLTQRRINRQYLEIEKLFTKEEAQVFRQGNTVIMRLVGLSFPSGKSTIGAEYQELLTKVHKALDIFPAARFMIEGHTDSFGSDETNAKLSLDRANVVKQHFAEKMNVDAGRIEAAGYGEMRPISTNNTEQGRAKNRRTDVIISPGAMNSE